MSEIMTKNDFKKLNYSGLEKMDKEAIKKQIETIISSETINHLFKENQNILIERTIVGPNGSIWRPDRVVIHNNNWVSVLDYKTGDFQKKHKLQILNYKELFIRMGYFKVDAYLVYIIKNDILKY